MENSDFPHSNSTETYTPIKRLGLSRKRKSVLPPDVQHNKIIKILDDKPSPSLLKKSQVPFINEVQSANQIKVECSSITSKESFNKIVDYEEKIKLVENRIEEKLRILSALKNNNSKKSELQNLIQTWKKGCKSAFLHLNYLLKERQKENIRPKVWLQSLGIWKLMVDNFQEDSEISLSDDSE